MHSWLIVAFLIAGTRTQVSQSADAPPVVAEIRVFSGALEVTTSARAKIMLADKRGEQIRDARLPLMRLPPAVYDVEVSLTDNRGVVQVTRAEHLAIVHYPDEGGRHLEVINFDAAFGALQVRARQGRLNVDDVALFREGDRSGPAAKPIQGSNYVLFVVPAGRYDVRSQQPSEPGRTSATEWLTQVNVPAGATRLRIVGAGN